MDEPGQGGPNASGDPGTNAPGRRPGQAIGLLAIAALLAGALGVGVVALTGGGPADADAARQTEPVSAEQAAADVEAAVDLARSLINRGQNGEAELLLDRTIDRYPREGGPRVLRASLHAAEDDFEAAYEDMEQALVLSEPHAELSFTTGFYAQKAGLLDEALKNMLRAQELNPESVKYPLYLGALHLQRHEPEDAKIPLLRVVQIDEGIAQAWGMLAQISLDENRLSVAAQHVRRARSLEPDNAAYRLLEARVLKRDHKPEAAATVLLAIPEAERLADIHIVNELGACFVMLGDEQRAAELFADATRYHPSDAELAYQAARLLHKLGDGRRALRFADKAKFLGSEAAAALAERIAEEELGG